MDAARAAELLAGARRRATQDNSVIIKPGERVAFAFPAGASVHNLEFKAAPAPTSCPQTKAAAGGTIDPNDAPPMPAFASSAGWEGYCTFPAAGTYAFVCGVHPEMTGTVVVRGRCHADTDRHGHRDRHRVTHGHGDRHRVTHGHGDRLLDCDRHRVTPATATAGATPAAQPTTSPTPPPTVLPGPTPTASPTAKPAPKISAASFKRSKRTLTVSGTTTATGKLTIKLAYKVGKKSRTKTFSVTVKGGKFSGTLKLSAGDAKKASKLAVTVSATGTPAGQEDGVRQAVSASRRCRRSCAASSISLWRHSDGPVDARDQPHAVHAAEVAVDERVARLGLVGRRPR